ncbi:LytR/AlgR family response regulator transcription factor [[Clostridium] scindens]|uniref:LytR/AlgR family response regulator transcription factor n=1 Tax=Clostridium scindens (strain JCM 10418 / VPI 12708) TaxID=29347 RepID=UPI001D07671E|nr:LytTR family DNA-binding domain-containing protein [[Clostridium] scindens]MCB6286255.1 LytTR family DNA-binding domain-containing protein [[Clostridium] scindens]MCB6421011.1 LytTR family DNA-binding domain-containing protein [[Clostridium] scindens]MCB7192770.1 LytTR family DNA-binding domain-containing protein [[Clostridium] scindens]MCB7285954.1 LytTR family DNA-binding domain-containing protein [[Clostridium] scindens]MCG4929918.1 LytTR family DNA-binding domain-containing protein [[Cl
MKVAVIDDMQEDRSRLLAYINKFQTEYGEDIQADCYQASLDFLEEYHNQYDVVFLDIEMPGSDGIEVAHEIRQKDSEVGIIFVTNMAQYAIQGYEVNAIDFIVKPVGYYVFAEKLEKAIRIHQRQISRDLLLHKEDEIYRIPIKDIYYVEKDRDYLVFHTTKGDFRERGTLKMLKSKLEEAAFSECTHGCLVNVLKVTRIGKEDISINDIMLPLSRRMKKQFTQDYLDYMGGRF